MSYASSIFGLLPTGRRAIGITQLLNKLESYLPPERVEQVREAYEFGAAAHEGQKRKSGEPYISHPVAVADLLADLHMDAQTIVAAILHDVLEDTPMSKEEIAGKFGSDVAEIVDGVSKLDQVQFKNRAEAQAESFRKMLLAMVRDIRVIMVKLADRTHNMRTLGAMSPARRRAIARETLEIYAPIANRLGIYNIKNELEDLGLKNLYPNRYKVIEKAVKRARGNQKQFIGNIKTNIEEALEKAGIKGRVEGREKHPYSIYQKMHRKKTALNEVVDVFGFRIIVDSVDTCYRALGIVHGIYRPMPGRFKDYIAIPRINGYQSLHTTLFGPNGMPIEVQIRTEAMQQVAESGIAAHWQYKEGADEDKTGHDRAREWLQHLIDMHGGNSEEFLESVKVDLFPDKVYVFTPKGEIRRLPRGATAVDFAYSVHTDIGNRCVAAKVDRRLVPLRTPLRNGQTIEIVTAKGAQPNPAWVNFVVTAKARTAIRHYLKSLKSGDAEELGKRLLTQALTEQGLNFKSIKPAQWEALATDFNLKNTAELFEKVGLGERLAPLVAQRLLPKTGDVTQAHESGPLAIAGTEGLSVSYARCCFPIPNDPIMAYVTTGHGIVIHREACGNLKSFRKQPDKWLSVVWQPAAGKLFSVEIVVQVKSRIGILAAIASEISATQTSIERVSIIERDGGVSTEVFELMVADRKQLAQVIKRIRKMPEVVKVTRSLT
ncbi:MAG TPA: bifunctional (p)ppGpp synthetase/guanosine-3',5'-bis(diphosphate) 3'-pyrophosphohydrolase [Steroidobacteraceae bacterium]|nr:bifunctional (p)ppGpp synthetase/guanosine-3',5'-bis(diphosphate) 3'-pyrophosphohydrolase [Steroidobacteraceae bacterium]